jgi:hypothetical protein
MRATRRAFNAHVSPLHPLARGYVVASTNTGHPGELFIPQGADGIDPGRAERRDISGKCRHEGDGCGGHEDANGSLGVMP